MLLVKVLLFLFVCNKTYTGKVFTFDSSTPEDLSYAALASPVISLPSIWILCTSHLETTIDNLSYFTIYGEDGKPWLTLSIWDSDGGIYLWARITTTWIRVYKLQRSWLNFWIHICTKVDVKSGILLLSINGEPTTMLDAQSLKNQTPQNLSENMVLGLSHLDESGQQQFSGSITNVNVWKGNESTDIQILSNSLCLQHADLINPDSKWRIAGNVNVENSEKHRKICDKNKTYQIAIPAPIDWTDAMKLCKNLGSGNMTELMNMEDIEHTLDLFKNINSPCKNIWTPLTDEENEGGYKSSITGRINQFLPWEVSEPNGFNDENHVLLKVSSKGYFDNVKSKKSTCVACDLFKTTIFTLRGVCKDSHFGNKK